MQQKETHVKGKRFVVFLTRDEDGTFISECPSLPGCVSQGKTKEEALTNIKDAVKGYLASLAKHNEPLPFVEEALVTV